ncbi:MAG: PAS domain S-box protein, partial [Methanoregula sp.]|nr:PAS domain S-box protein [Methanoregula sp.]
SPNLPKDPVTRKRLDEIVVAIGAVQNFTLCLSKGDLDSRLDVKGISAGCLKSLQSNLKHLTWQAQQIADGDFSQRVDFMGEFSEAFNYMVRALDAARAEMKQRELELSSLNARLLTEVAVRRQVEDTLRKSEERYRTILEQATDAIFIHDETGRVIDVNRKACQSLGYSREELLSKSIGDIDPDAIQAEKHKLWGKVIAGEHFTFESHQRRKDGGAIPVEVSLGSVHLPDRRVIIGTVRDITERKRAEEALRESEERYRVLFEESPISLFEEDFSDIKVWIDTKTNENIRDFRTWLESHPEDVSGCAIMVKVTHINRATMALFGAASHKEFSEGLSSIFTEDSYDAFREEIIALAEGKNEFEGEVQIQTLNGERKIVLLKVTVVPGNEQTFSKILVSIIDISNVKRVEGALRQANKQLNILSGITRHDILNQLMALKGYLELSHEVIDNPTTLIEYIAKEEKAANTIEHQITFTRDYQELGVAAPAWQNVNASIKNAVGELPMRDVHVDVERPDLEIFADRLFEKVFYNLIDNALNYGGERMKTIRVSSQESDRGFIIVCEDDGVGITDEDKKKLFRKGFGKHTGLGLFLSREILAITGITITENGTPGTGARFEITVPKGMYRFTGTGEK